MKRKPEGRNFIKPSNRIDKHVSTQNVGTLTGLIISWIEVCSIRIELYQLDNYKVLQNILSIFGSNMKKLE